MLPRMLYSTATLATVALLATACYVRVDHDHPTTDAAGSSTSSDPSAQSSSTSSPESPLSQQQPAAKSANCLQRECHPVSVNVHYMLTEDLGTSNLLKVEAFDNPRFTGSPVATAQTGGFAATRPGDSARLDLDLPSGTYFLRAYIDNHDTPNVPYAFQDMQLMSEKPVGVFGALSNAGSLKIHDTDSTVDPKTADIYVDQLFKKPQAATPSEANLRVLLSTNDLDRVPTARKLIIALFDDSDLAKKPVAQFTVATENLLVDGRKGKAEYLASDLPIGTYVVFAYVDADGNGFYDPGELAAVSGKGGQTSPVRLVGKRTETLSLNLTSATIAAH